MSLEGLDGGGPVREPSDRREALHGEMKGVTVLIAGSEKGPWGADTNKCMHTRRHARTHARKDMTDTIGTSTHTFNHTDRDKTQKQTHELFKPAQNIKI